MKWCYNCENNVNVIIIGQTFDDWMWKILYLVIIVILYIVKIGLWTYS